MIDQHTLWPWIANGREIVCHPVPDSLSTVTIARFAGEGDESDANVRLAAAAPAMLAALRKAERFLAGFEGDTEVLDDPIDDDLNEIRAILAQIGGGAA